jgi:hypothetical protein
MDRVQFRTDPPIIPLVNGLPLLPEPEPAPERHVPRLFYLVGVLACVYAGARLLGWGCRWDGRCTPILVGTWLLACAVLALITWRWSR